MRVCIYRHTTFWEWYYSYNSAHTNPVEFAIESMEAIADNVIGLLGSLAGKELELLSNFQDDLETMNRKVTGLRAVLFDAGTRATESKAIIDWLQKLKDVLLDAEDLLDAHSAEELAREVMTKDKKAKEQRGSERAIMRS